MRWGTALHDRFLLPYFLEQDFHDVIGDLTRVGIPIESEWFAAQFEFRFPSIGQIDYQGVHVELRQALEPWYVLGEQPGATGAARPVDTSLERLQVRITGITDDRYLVTCNRRRVPLHPTGIAGEAVAAVRYRAWRPRSACTRIWAPMLRWCSTSSTPGRAEVSADAPTTLRIPEDATTTSIR